MAIEPNPQDSARTLIYDGLAQNDVDMAHHRLLNLDTSNLPPVGIPPTIVLPQNQWLHGWDAPSQTWQSSRPTFLDIGPDNGTLTSDQQSRISEVGHVRLGTWDATPLDPSKVPTLDAIRLPLANVNLNSKRITLLADPVDPGDAVNKRFMDFLLQGLNPKQAVKCATTREIILQGTQTIDGIPVNVGDRVLVKDQTSRQQENGIYVVTSGPAHWDRSPDCFHSDDLIRAYCAVLLGTQNSGTSWVQATPSFVHDPPSYPPDLVVFLQFSALPGGGSGGFTAGAGLTLVSGVLNVGGTPGRIAVLADSVDIDPAYSGQASITTLGSVTAGSWQAGVIDSSFGGTGVNNLGNTIAIEGNLNITNPSFALDPSLTFIINGACSVTVPAAGILATREHAETFTNKRITRRVVKIASNPNPAINVDVLDVFCITGLVEAILSMSTNLTGTPTDRQQLEIWIKSATGTVGPGYTIAWGAAFIDSSDLPLPAKVSPDVQMFLIFNYNSELTKWVLTQKLDNIS